jgi:hypothetical protein
MEKQFWDENFQGYLGLGPAGRGIGGVHDFVSQLELNKVINKRMFSLIYNESLQSKDKLSCSIVFGDYISNYTSNEQDKDKFYSQMTFINTRDHNSWEVQMGYFRIRNNKTKKNKTLDVETRYIVFEPSSPYLYMPLRDFESFKEDLQ